MIWQFLIAAAIAVGFLQLGAMSVWVSVLSFVIKAGLVIVIAVALYFSASIARRRFKRRHSQQD
jgi:hypothetical protein